MFSLQRKKEALGRGAVKLMPRNLQNGVCEHVSNASNINVVGVKKLLYNQEP